MISTRKNGLNSEPVKQKHVVTGKIISGAGKAAFFTRLDWVVEQCRAKLGFAPFPGTLNIEILPESLPGVEILLAGKGVELLPPDPASCSSRVVPVRLEGIQAAVIIPEEKVRIHDRDVVEVLAPVNLRKALKKEDGNLVSITVVQESGSRNEALLKPREKISVEAIMLDLDGTIIDSVEIYYRIVQKVLEQLHLPGVSVEQIHRADRNGNFHWEMLFPPGMVEDRAGVTEKAWTIARRISPGMFKGRVKLLPGAARVLKKISAAGFKLAVVTATPRQNMASKLEPLAASGTLNLLQEIITADDTVKRKPAADPLLECCRRLAVEAEKCVYVGDTQMDIRAGKAAGTGTIGVLTGFDSYEALAKEKPDAIIKSLADLDEVIKKSFQSRLNF